MFPSLSSFLWLLLLLSLPFSVVWLRSSACFPSFFLIFSTSFGGSMTPRTTTVDFDRSASTDWIPFNLSKKIKMKKHIISWFYFDILISISSYFYMYIHRLPFIFSMPLLISWTHPSQCMFIFKIAVLIWGAL